MNLSDITKINFGSAGISAVYNGTIKLWPTGTGADNKVMKFTIVSGDTWNNTRLSAYTADNKYITPVKKDATGWTYDENVKYLSCNIFGAPENLLTFEGFAEAVKIKSGYYLFYDNRECTDISTANMDTSECTDMESMFSGCLGLTSLDLSNFNTSQVTNMSDMFSECSKLTSLDLSNFDTLKVTNMTRMFINCRSLTSLDLSNWDTSNVMSMNWMFDYCSALQTVKMTNCSQETKDKIRAALDAAGRTSTVITE